MRRFLRTFDDGLARGEAALATVFLVAMVLFATLQVVVDNLALRQGLGLALELRQQLGWIDGFLKRATVVLAFLGASLAVHGKKHIAIDVVGRLLPSGSRRVLQTFLYGLAGVICLYLARVFYEASVAAALADAQDRALDVYVLGTQHVCDADEASLREAGLERPSWFCGLRQSFAGLGLAHQDGGQAVPVVDVPEALLRFVAPTMLLVMAGRFLFQALAAGFSRSTLREQAAGGEGDGGRWKR